MAAQRGTNTETLSLFLELDAAADALSPWLDGATLGRFACASRRALAINTTGSFASTWKRAADKLDAVFPLVRRGNLEVDPTKGADQWGSQEGWDPRLPIMYPALVADRGRLYGKYPSEEAFEAATALWHAVPSMKRVSLVVNWQLAVAEAVRLGPEDWFVETYEVDEGVEPRFDGHYSYEFREMTHALRLVIKCAMLKCVAYERAPCDISRSHARDILAGGGWGRQERVNVDFFSSSAREGLWYTIVGEDDVPIVSKSRVLELCEPEADVASLAPILGATTTRSLLIIRGPLEDLPPGWEDEFYYVSDEGDVLIDVFADDDDDDHHLGQVIHNPNGVGLVPVADLVDMQNQMQQMQETIARLQQEASGAAVQVPTLTLAEKIALSDDINALRADQLPHLVRIVQDGMTLAHSLGGGGGDEIEVDLDTLDADTLRRVRHYIDSALGRGA